MNKYNDEYYIVFEHFNESTLYLKKTKQTAKRYIGWKELEFGLEPAFFENGYKDEDKKHGIKRAISSAHMNGNTIIINNDLRDKIKHFDISGLQLYPSVIIDDDDYYHDGYWVLNNYQRLECLDYDNCIIEDYVPGDDNHEIDKYYLSETVLDAIPEEQRLIIKPDNTDMDYAFFHKRIVDIFNKYGVETLRFIKVSEWEGGCEFTG